MWKEGLSEKEYHNGPELSSHRLIDAARLTGTKYKAKYESEQEKKLLFDFGSIYHMAVLEPEAFDSMSKIAILPDEKRPTSSQLGAAKPAQKTIELIEFWNQWDGRNAGKYHIKQEEYDNVIEMVKVLKKHDHANDVLFHEPGRNELSGYFEIGGNKCRMRADRVLDCGYIVDLKSASDASYDAFKKQGFGWKKGEGHGYQTQGALYKDGAQLIEPKEGGYFFKWIVQEKTFPYDIAIYGMDREMYIEGKEEYMSGMRKHIAYIKNGYWPGYSEQTQTISR